MRLDWRHKSWWAERAEKAQAVFLAEKLAPVPRAWQGRVKGLYVKKRAADWGAADGWLVGLSNRFKALRVPVNLSDAEIIELGNKCARECLDLATVGLMEAGAYRGRLERYCGRYGVTPPERQRITKRGRTVGVPDGPAIARMTDGQWWRGRLRKSQARALEGEAIGLGYVHRRAEIYASTATVERRGQQRARNAGVLEGVEAVNQTTGETYTLAELAALSVANPAIRRGELMTRIAGFEAIAKGVGDAAEFVTQTAPSRYHPMRTAGPRVEPNPVYAGATPREAQGYHVGVWACIRAALARVGIKVYGFRIAEPHHDATPHWHMLLFIAPAVVATFRAIFRKYSLADSPDEKGAQENRVKFVSIDPAKGTAAGYIAKYVSKNIDGGGYVVQRDIQGYDAITPSARVEAWAATWGIRQFQQIGGPPVGVWRELRRMPDRIEASETVEAARSAADAGNWRRYVEVQGGPVVKREELPLRVACTRPGERWDVIADSPVPAPMTRYGETAPGAVYGVRDVVKDAAYISRIYRWEIRRAGNAGMFIDASRVAGGVHGGGCGVRRVSGIGIGVDFRVQEVGGLDARSLYPVGSGGVGGKEWDGMGSDSGFASGAELARCGGVVDGEKVLGGSGLAGIAGPWTRVNNCTEGGKDEAGIFAGGGVFTERAGDGVNQRGRRKGGGADGEGDGGANGKGCSTGRSQAGNSGADGGGVPAGAASGVAEKGRMIQ